MSKLLCPECRHENEMERVYCHNCGAKLTRTEAASIPGQTDDAETVATRERLRRMMDNRGVKARQIFLSFAKLILAACLVATLIQMFLSPDLPPAGKDLELGPQIGLDLENAVLQHRGAQVSYTDDQVNAYLVGALKRKKTTMLDKPMLDFERGVVQFDEGMFRMTVARSCFGCPLYSSAFYRVNIQGGKLSATGEGGAIGRMPIHPQLMQFANFLVGDVFKALEQDRKEVEKFAALEFHPHTVVMTAPSQ